MKHPANKINTYLTGFNLKPLFIFLLLIFALQLFTFNAFGQSITWQRLYRGPSNVDYYGNDICQTTDGNFILAGNRSNQGAFITKINSNGDTLWSKFITLTGANTAVATENGSCVYAGGSKTTKLDINGNIIWDIPYTSYTPQIRDMQRTQDNGYILCGSLTSERSYIAKLNSLGALQWENIYPQVFDSRFHSVIQDSQGYFIAAGIYWETFTDTIKISLLKLDTGNNVIFDRKYNNGGGYAHEVLEQNNIYLLLCGRTVEKFNNSGTYLSTTNLSLESNETAKDMEIISGNRYLFATNKNYFQPSNIQSFIKICDTSGNIIRNRHITLPDYNELECIINLSNGDKIAFGTAGYDTSNWSSYFAIRTDSLLNAPPISIQNISENLPLKFELFQNYPNPFNYSTVIKFDITKHGRYMLFIYNVLGQQIEKLFDYDINPGTYKLSYSNYNLSSGIYFYKLYSHDVSITKSFVIIK